jgi:hypothetical protein
VELCLYFTYIPSRRRQGQLTLFYRFKNGNPPTEVFQLGASRTVAAEFGTKACSKQRSEFAVLHIFASFPISVALQPNSGLGHLAVEDSISHTIRHKRPVGLLWMSDQLIAEAATYTTHIKYKRRTFMPSTIFEPAIPASGRRQRVHRDRPRHSHSFCIFVILPENTVILGGPTVSAPLTVNAAVRDVKT